MQVPFVPLVPAKLPGGQLMAPVVNDEVSCGLFCMLTRPAGCGHDTVPPLAEMQVGAGDWELANGAPKVLKSVPAEAVVSFEDDGARLNGSSIVYVPVTVPLLTVALLKSKLSLPLAVV